MILFGFEFVGPVVAEAMFSNREEVPVHPIYRDPVSQNFVLFASDFFAVMLLIASLILRVCLNCK
jgi:hypothetical protein